MVSHTSSLGSVSVEYTFDELLESHRIAEPLFAQRHAPVKVTRLYTGSDGKTHVEEYEVPLKSQGRGTELSDAVSVKDLQFRRTNQDYSLDWHPATSGPCSKPPKKESERLCCRSWNVSRVLPPAC